MAHKAVQSTLWKSSKSLFSLHQTELCFSWEIMRSFSTEPKSQQPFLLPFLQLAFTSLNFAGPQEKHPSGWSLKLFTQHSCRELNVGSLFHLLSWEPRRACWRPKAELYRHFPPGYHSWDASPQSLHIHRFHIGRSNLSSVGQIHRYGGSTALCGFIQGTWASLILVSAKVLEPILAGAKRQLYFFTTTGCSLEGLLSSNLTPSLFIYPIQMLIQDQIKTWWKRSGNKPKFWWWMEILRKKGEQQCKSANTLPPTPETTYS